MAIFLDGLSLGCVCNYSETTQSLDCSASCNVQGKRMKEDIVDDGKCKGVMFVRNLGDGHMSRILKAYIMGYGDGGYGA